jgi:hypothetical protein
MELPGGVKSLTFFTGPGQASGGYFYNPSPQRTINPFFYRGLRNPCRFNPFFPSPAGLV